MTSHKKPQAWQNGLILVISLLLSLAGAEGLARLMDIRPLESRLERYEFDPLVGWRTIPGRTTFISRAEYAHYLYYDQAGFPTNRERQDGAPDPKLPSIALLGDSFVEGYYLPYDQTFAALLEERLDAQVLNFGVSGYSPAQYLVTARQRFLDYRIEIAIVFLFGKNDVPYVYRDRYQGYAIPRFGDPAASPENTPLPRLDGEALERSLLQGALDRLALWSLVKPAVANLMRLEEVESQAEPLLQNEMARALELIAQIGLDFPETRLLVYYIPDLVEIQTPDVLAHNLDAFQQACAALEIACILPTPLIENAAPEELYWPRDRHFSAAGAQALAEQLVQVVTNEP